MSQRYQWCGLCKSDDHDEWHHTRGYSCPLCKPDNHEERRSARCCWDEDIAWNSRGRQHAKYHEISDECSKQTDGWHPGDNIRFNNERSSQDICYNYDDDRNLSHSWRPRRQSLQVSLEASRPVHYQDCCRKPQFPRIDKPWSSNFDSGCESELKKLASKNETESFRKTTEESRITALAEETYRKMIAQDQRKAEEKAHEANLVREKKEMEQRYEAERVKALAHQRAFIEKELENKVNIVKAELAFRLQAEIKEKELLAVTMASMIEAGQKTAEQKAKADRLESQRLEALAKETAEKHKKQEAERQKQEAAEKHKKQQAERQKQEAERQRQDAKRKEAELQEQANREKQEKQRAEDSKMLLMVQNRLSGLEMKLKEHYTQPPGDHDLKPDAGSLKNNVNPKGGAKTESPRVESTDICKRATGITGLYRERRSTAGDEVKGHEDHQKRHSKKKSLSKSQKAALTAMAWFAGG